MNTAWAKKTNVTNFTTAQHSLRCRFLGRTQQVLNSTLFIYADTTLTTIQHFLFTPTQHSPTLCDDLVSRTWKKKGNKTV